MITIDYIGLVITVCLVGLRYPQYVLGACILHDLGRVLMALFLHGHIDSIVTAGAFGSTAASNIRAGVPALLVTFSGPLTNYIFSATAGGIDYLKTRHILNPWGAVKHPFAVVNLRLAVLSLLVNLWQLIFV
jgi:hypothetical protein